MSNPNQYVLVGDVDDVNATGYEKEGMSLVFHPYTQSRTDNGVPEDTSLLKEQRYRRNMATSHEFIRSILNHMGIRSYYDRVVALFDASMAKGKFRFGTRATAIIGACILITMREAGIPETLKSLAARLKLTPARLTGSTYKILSLHGMHLKPTDPLNYIPAVLRAISDILASPSGSLPAPLRTYLSTPSLNAVQNLATDLCYLTEIVNLTHNRQAPPLAGSPSTSGSTADTATRTTPSVALRDTATNATSTRGLSPPLFSDDGQDSEARPAKRAKRVPEVASTKLRGNFVRATATPTPMPRTETTATACLRPAYAQRSKKRKSKRETWDANLAKATATLLGGGRGSIASYGKSGGGGGSHLGITKPDVDADDSVGDFVRKHVLAMGIREASERMGTRGVSLGRLERLALVVGEANIGDEVLFDDGEMEGYLRDNDEVEILKKIWEAQHGADEGGYDEDDVDGQVERVGVPGSTSSQGGAQRTRKAAPPPKSKKGKKEKQVKTMNFGALELALSSLNRGSPADGSGSGASSVTGESSTIERWELDLLERLVDDEDKENGHDDDVYDEDKDDYGDDRDEDGYYRAPGGMSYDPYEEFEEL
ncbi:hypothetical protein FRC00_007834 [Tulasnella sp. 408]|nr:hypothetical protein FRC00_007834 [Tulasnella sp. 408]